MIGSRLGIYQVEAKLGAGAMGEVYKARDTRLGRDVAVKVLPQAFTQDPDRLARFEREAKLLASLSHPNIATVYGLEEADGVRALVMELVPGESLAARIARGPLPVPEALDVARQIAVALDAAHDNGVIHRDLKPANVLLTAEGIVKVVDFGLAKSHGIEGASGSGASMTVTSIGTSAGLILGTAAFMSPEQARGKPVDRRTDVWAFACVLYEILTGRPAFGGETVTDILAAIVHEEPDWSALPAPGRARIERLLRRALAKDARERISDLGDVALELRDIAQDKTPAIPAAVASLRPVTPWALIGLVAAAALAAGFAGGRRTAPAASAAESAGMPESFQQLTVLPGGEGQPSISPDGESFAYVAGPPDASDIFVQRIGGRNATRVTGDCKAGDTEPAFSPDGRLIAYRSECSGGGIFVMGATGESPRKVSDTGYAPAWSPDGRALAVVTEQISEPWARSTKSTLWAVDVESGKRRKLSDHDAMQPVWSPDGRRVAFWGLTGDSSNRDLYSVAADGSQSGENAAIQITDDAHLDWSPVWGTGGGSLYFSSSRGGTFNLWRIAVDPATGRAAGLPEPVTAPSSWAGYVSLSRDGRRLLFVDRNARTIVRRAPFDPVRGTLAGPQTTVPMGTFEVFGDLSLSPDGASLVFSNAGLPQHLFFVRSDGAGLVQLTDGPYRDRQAAFSPDGTLVVFQTTRYPGALGLIRADGSGLRAIPLDQSNVWYPSWTPDGTHLVCGGRTGPFLVDARATDGPGTPVLIGPQDAAANFWPSSVSSDGRLVVGTVFDAAAVPVALAVRSLPDGAERRIAAATDYGDAKFLPDGRRFLHSTGGRISLLDISGASAREIVAAPEGQQISGFAISRDGRWLAWIEAADESDVWMATLDGSKDSE